MQRLHGMGSDSINLPANEPLVLRNGQVQLLLNVRGSRPSLGKRVQLWDDSFNQGNHWLLSPIEGTRYFHIRTRLVPALCLGLEDPDPGNFSAVQMATLVNPDHWSAQWKFRLVKAGVYQIGNAVALPLEGGAEQVCPLLLLHLVPREQWHIDTTAPANVGTQICGWKIPLLNARLAMDEWSLLPAPALPEVAPEAMVDMLRGLSPVSFPVSGSTVLLQHAQTGLFLNIRGNNSYLGQHVRLWDGANNKGNQCGIASHAEHVLLVGL